MTPTELFSKLYALEMSANCFRVLFWLMAGNRTLRGCPFAESSARTAVTTLKKMGLVGGDVDAFTVLLPGLPAPGPLEPPPQITAQEPAPPVAATPAPPAIGSAPAMQAPGTAPPQSARYVFHNQKAFKFMTRPRPQQEQALASWAITGANLDDHSTAAQAAAALMAQQAPPPDCEPALAMAEDFAQILFPA